MTAPSVAVEEENTANRPLGLLAFIYNASLRMNNRDSERPLKGRTVLLTRAQGQSMETATQLERFGANVVYCPAIEFVEPDTWQPLDAAIDSLADYNWIIFTSANGVRFFVGRLQVRGLIVDSLEKLTVCAIGPATSRALEESGISASLVVRDSKAEGALVEIIDHVRKPRLEGLRFLVPRAKVAREFLPDKLRRLGARVDAVEAYQTIKPESDGVAIRKLLENRKIDAVTFTSSSTVSNFAAIVGTEDLSHLLQDIVVACIGPITARTAAEYGLTVVAQPATYTSEALVKILVRALTSST